MKKYFSIVLLTAIVINLQAQVTPVKTVVSAPVIAKPAVVAFKTNATYMSGNPIANNTPQKVDFNGHPLFDEGNNFSMEKDEFTAPSNGFYHFDVRVGWDKFSAPAMITIRVLTNWYATVPVSTFLPANTTVPIFDTNFSTVVSLKAGDKVSVELIQDSGRQQTYKQVQLMGFRIN